MVLLSHENTRTYNIDDRYNVDTQRGETLGTFPTQESADVFAQRRSQTADPVQDAIGKIQAMLASASSKARTPAMPGRTITGRSAVPQGVPEDAVRQGLLQQMAGHVLDYLGAEMGGGITEAEEALVPTGVGDFLQKYNPVMAPITGIKAGLGVGRALFSPLTAPGAAISRTMTSPEAAQTFPRRTDEGRAAVGAGIETLNEMALAPMKLIGKGIGALATKTGKSVLGAAPRARRISKVPTITPTRSTPPSPGEIEAPLAGRPTPPQIIPQSYEAGFESAPRNPRVPIKPSDPYSRVAGERGMADIESKISRMSKGEDLGTGLEQKRVRPLETMDIRDDPMSSIEEKLEGVLNTSARPMSDFMADVVNRRALKSIPRELRNAIKRSGVETQQVESAPWGGRYTPPGPNLHIGHQPKPLAQWSAQQNKMRPEGKFGVSPIEGRVSPTEGRPAAKLETAIDSLRHEYGHTMLEPGVLPDPIREQAIVKALITNEMLPRLGEYYGSRMVPGGKNLELAENYMARGSGNHLLPKDLLIRWNSLQYELQPLRWASRPAIESQPYAHFDI